MNQLLGTMNARPHSAHEGNHRSRVHRLETQNDVTPTCHSKSVLPALRKQPAEKYLSGFFVRVNANTPRIWTSDAGPSSACLTEFHRWHDNRPGVEYLYLSRLVRRANGTAPLFSRFSSACWTRSRFPNGL